MTARRAGQVRLAHPHPDHAHTPDPGHARGSVTHVILLDGTLCSLEEPWLTHIGRIYHLLREIAEPARLSMFYEEGIQMTRWREVSDVALGRGINRQIRRAYGFLASRYRPGDRIFLFGFSRGAFAVRSLAGMIDRVGLLRAEEATVRAIRTAYRHYRMEEPDAARAAFRAAYAHPGLTVDFVGVFDTVKALGVTLPGVRRWSEPAHAFHDHRLGPTIRHGCQALALNETRVAYTPVLWETRRPPTPLNRVEQVWFRGAHSDIGGKMEGLTAPLPLAHIPLVWMLRRAGGEGLPLPDGWRGRFPCDPRAPMRGNLHGWARLFLNRRARVVGADPSERVHPTALRLADPDHTLDPLAPGG
ncbi:DUF2235 domain-containing protein [Pararhodobacter sp. SW119]|uniref:DUF2235 domain-containing protein n=1 Tax=Pararhodobacter sp. SW119 TaxID=2780075 RepID=UPI001ADFCBB2|nr:DUF2235 domain-containing protein [Pararhodobacter sp. SW119]